MIVFALAYLSVFISAYSSGFNFICYNNDILIVTIIIATPILFYLFYGTIYR